MHKLQKAGRKLEKRKFKAKKKDEPLTDQEIENTYTGFDREIAEGFISLAMEPAASRKKSQPSISGHESF